MILFTLLVHQVVIVIWNVALVILIWHLEDTDCFVHKSVIVIKNHLLLHYKNINYNYVNCLKWLQRSEKEHLEELKLLLLIGS